MELGLAPELARGAAQNELQNIYVVLTRHDRDFAHASAVRCILTLQQILDNYMLLLGHSNQDVLAIFIELMAQGKVRVEFRDYYERLQLEDDTLRLDEDRTQQLFCQYLPQAPTEKVTKSSANVTQKIIVQAPKRVSLKNTPELR